MMIEREEQIFQLWEQHPFDRRTLATTCGKALKILSPGILNRDSGPDFFDARIELDGQVWSGNIEIHVRASDWKKHGHTTDKAFSNVILHVVHVYDCDIYDDHGNVIPVLVLSRELLRMATFGENSTEKSRKGRKGKSVGSSLGYTSSFGCTSSFDYAQDDKSSRGDASSFDYAQDDKSSHGYAQDDKSERLEKLPDPMVLKAPGKLQSLESFGISRLVRRCSELQSNLVALKGDMEALFRRYLFRTFGMRTNSEPFQQLCHRVPGTVIRRQRNNLTDLEAILFGQSALLPEIPVDAYSADLLYRYQHFRYKYGLEPMYIQAWKFMRMRPSNFPTIRISQLANLLHREEHIYARCMNHVVSEESLREMLDVCASDYWDDHFRFGVYSGKFIKQMGEDAVDSVLINAVAPVRYFLGVQTDDEDLKESAIGLLRELKAENNVAIRRSGRIPMNALESQGVLELLTVNRGSNEPNDIVSDNDFAYFSGTNYERDKIHRPYSSVVREPGVRRLRLVG